MAGFGGGCHWAAKPDRLQSALCCHSIARAHRLLAADFGELAATGSFTTRASFTRPCAQVKATSLLTHVSSHQFPRTLL